METVQEPLRASKNSVITDRARFDISIRDLNPLTVSTIDYAFRMSQHEGEINSNPAVNHKVFGNIALLLCYDVANISAEFVVNPYLPLVKVLNGFNSVRREMRNSRSE